MPLRDFAIVDSTLREGEQFARAHFTTAQKRELALALDGFGVEYVEMTNPAASPASFEDARMVAGLGLRAQVLVHCRCNLADAERAVATGAQGVNVLFGTSRQLRQHSHGRSIEQIVEAARQVIGYLQSQGVETRFSCEDAFRTPLDTLLEVYGAVDALGVDRVGIADTVGVADPQGVREVVGAVRATVRSGIEFHGHNDSGCAIANAYAALQAGATHIDTTILGIGERNGITPLGGLIARLYATDRELVRRYDLPRLQHLDRRVSEMTGVPIPFNNYVTGETAFSHKAGLHTKAVLSDPSSYEALDPADFGLERRLDLGHRLTGWNAVAHRAASLGLTLDECQARAATTEIKRLADHGPLSPERVDEVLLSWTNVAHQGGRTWAL
ncbi:MAG: homocitrate synthase [Chloroflexota bacterium]|nr:homocitrate synthase [Chloroflexota bacterium]